MNEKQNFVKEHKNEIMKNLRQDPKNWWVNLPEFLYCIRCKTTDKGSPANSEKISFASFERLIEYLKDSFYINGKVFSPLLKKNIVIDDYRRPYKSEYLKTLDDFKQVCSRNSNDEPKRLSCIIQRFYKSDSYDSYNTEQFIKEFDLSDMFDEEIIFRASYVSILQEFYTFNNPIAKTIRRYDIKNFFTLSNKIERDTSANGIVQIDNSFIGKAGITPIEMKKIYAANNYSTTETAKYLSKELGQPISRQNVYKFCNDHNISIHKEYKPGTSIGDLTILEALPRTDTRKDPLRFKCRCKCGKELIVHQTSIIQNKRKSKYAMICSECRKNGKRRLKDSE